MAYLERGAMVRISKVSNLPQVLSGPTVLSVTPLSYDGNTNVIQEENRLCFSTLMTTFNSGSYEGLFSHAIKTTEYTTTNAQLLPASYRTGYERPLYKGDAIESSELSCSLCESGDGIAVGIQMMNSNYYSDTAVDNSTLIEMS